ncbi:hypothetical protein CcCBS67573_g01731 [Chytriomyces confervae]|uniref:Uncharacterized protein n=1 Tax=Chytriomyces confervae TaxID=246404 RepID=A0A507FL01_9FUNG|nr:hypothetical protein CcCBS67573_g01731 [Chytriomyces confervae]
MADTNWCFCGKATNGPQLYCSDTCLRSDGYCGPCVFTTTNTHSLHAQQQQQQQQPRFPQTQNNGALVDPLSPTTATNPFASTHYTRVITASNLVVAPQPQRLSTSSSSSSSAMYPVLYNRNHSATFSPVSSPPRQSYSPVPSREATFLSPGRVSTILGHFEQIAEQQHRLRSR